MCFVSDSHSQCIIMCMWSVYEYATDMRCEIFVVHCKRNKNRKSKASSLFWKYNNLYNIQIRMMLWPVMCVSSLTSDQLSIIVVYGERYLFFSLLLEPRQCANLVEIYEFYSCVGCVRSSIKGLGAGRYLQYFTERLSAQPWLCISLEIQTIDFHCIKHQDFTI